MGLVLLPPSLFRTKSENMNFFFDGFPNIISYYFSVILELSKMILIEFNPFTSLLGPVAHNHFKAPTKVFRLRVQWISLRISLVAQQLNMSSCFFSKPDLKSLLMFLIWLKVLRNSCTVPQSSQVSRSKKI